MSTAEVMKSSGVCSKCGRQPVLVDGEQEHPGVGNCTNCGRVFLVSQAEFEQPPRERLTSTLQAIETTRAQVGTWWRHLKTGGVYRVVELSIDEAWLIPLVTYKAPEVAYKWTRSLAVFLGQNDDGTPRFEKIDSPDPGEAHYVNTHRCKRCGSAELKPHGMGSEIFRWSCSTCGADPA